MHGGTTGGGGGGSGGGKDMMEVRNSTLAFNQAVSRAFDLTNLTNLTHITPYLSDLLGIRVSKAFSGLIDSSQIAKMTSGGGGKDMMEVRNSN